jgi:hypothetical protein
MFVALQWIYIPGTPALSQVKVLSPPYLWTVVDNRLNALIKLIGTLVYPVNSWSMQVYGML